MARPVKDLTGKRFGSWTVIGNRRYIRNNIYWDCRCDCGTVKAVRSTSLLGHCTYSCGCRGASYTHGQSSMRHRTGTYKSWLAMRNRCNNPKNADYAYYGGRGITVCERWNSFVLFLKDMGERPKGTSIDRINNSLGYSPDNCRWATAQMQNSNRRF